VSSVPDMRIFLRQRDRSGNLSESIYKSLTKSILSM